MPSEKEEDDSQACNAISKADFKSKSFIALKEARESLYWIELLHRNNYIDDKQYDSIYTDCEELVKILVTRCKKLDQQLREEKMTSDITHPTSALVSYIIHQTSYI